MDSPSLDGTHVAVVTEHQLALANRAGRIIWRRQRRSVSRWLRDDEITAAAGPRGEWVVVTGGANYRYAILLDGKGTPRGTLKTHGTPRSVTFDHAGARFAVGTAAGRIYLASVPATRTPMRSSMEALPVDTVRELKPGGIIEGLAFSPDDRLLATTSAGETVTLTDTTGHVLWQRSVQLASLEPDKEWTSFLLCELPWHGPEYGGVSVVSRSGQDVWRKTYYAPRGALSPDGRFVLLRAGVATRDPLSAPFPYPPLEWIVLDRHGARLSAAGPGRRRSFRTTDRSRVVIERNAWRAEAGPGRLLWRAPLPVRR